MLDNVDTPNHNDHWSSLVLVSSFLSHNGPHQVVKQIKVITRWFISLLGAWPSTSTPGTTSLICYKRFSSHCHWYHHCHHRYHHLDHHYCQVGFFSGPRYSLPDGPVIIIIDIIPSSSDPPVNHIQSRYSIFPTQLITATILIILVLITLQVFHLVL